MTGQAAKTADVSRWLEAYAAASVRDDELERFTVEVNEQLRAAVPELGADEGLLADLTASTRESLRTFLPALASDPAREVAVPPAARDLARAFALRRIDLTALLKLYRVAQDILWRRVMTIVSEEVEHPDLRMAILAHVWEHGTRRLDATIDTLVATYTEERERRLRGALARRSETVYALLAGDSLDPDEAERLLGHPVRRHQTAFVLWAQEGAGEADVLGRLEALAAALASAMGAGRALTLPSGARGLWAWVATDREPQLEDLTSISALQATGGVRVAAGMPAYGLAGFRSSHREALLAQRVAVAGTRDRPLTLYGDVEIVSLISGDPEVVRSLVTRELAGLAARDPATERLRETARAFLAAGANARKAAELLGTHKNTVLYRIARVEELLGHPVTDRRMHVELALMLVDAFGDELLPSRP